MKKKGSRYKIVSNIPLFKTISDETRERISKGVKKSWAARKKKAKR